MLHSKSGTRAIYSILQEDHRMGKTDGNRRKFDAPIAVALIELIGTLIVATATIITAIISKTPSPTSTQPQIVTSTATPSPPSIRSPNETSTSTFVPQPISSSPPPTASRLIFIDNLKDNTNLWQVGKRNLPFTQIDTEFTDNQYQFNAFFRNDAFSWVNVPTLTLRDFYLTIDAEVIQQSKPGNVGIVLAFRYQDLGQTSYAVAFNEDNSYELDVRQNGNWQQLDKENNPSQSIPEGTTYQIGVNVYGQDITPYINNHKLDTFTNSTIRSAGGIGIGAHGAQGQSMLVGFSNLVISQATSQ